MVMRRIARVVWRLQGLSFTRKKQSQGGHFSMNKLLVTGRLVDFKDKKTGKYESDFLRFKTFDKTANFLDSYIKKGAQIEIEGSISNNNYEKDGKMVYQNDFVANRVNILSHPKGQEIEPENDDSEVPF
jgi:single-stranded DNA-binding protein